MARQTRGTPLGAGYVKVAPIGEGPTGTVWRGASADGSPVAIKVLHAQFATDPAIAERFTRQRRVLEPLVSSRLVHQRELVIDASTLAIVMELVTGTNLREYLRHHGTLRPALAFELAEQVLQGLSAVHHAGVMHHDLKPENVMIDLRDPRNPHALVADAGIMHGIGPVAYIALGASSYRAPEQGPERPETVASDIYAVGALLVEMIIGRPPEPGAAMLPIIPGLPSGAAAAVTSMLAPRPGDRPRSANAARSQLIDAADRVIGLLPLPPVAGAAQWQESQRPARMPDQDGLPPADDQQAWVAAEAAGLATAPDTQAWVDAEAAGLAAADPVPADPVPADPVPGGSSGSTTPLDPPITTTSSESPTEVLPGASRTEPLPPVGPVGPLPPVGPVGPLPPVGPVGPLPPVEPVQRVSDRGTQGFGPVGPRRRGISRSQQLIGGLVALLVIGGAVWLGRSLGDGSSDSADSGGSVDSSDSATVRGAEPSPTITGPAETAGTPSADPDDAGPTLSAAQLRRLPSNRPAVLASTSWGSARDIASAFPNTIPSDADDRGPDGQTCLNVEIASPFSTGKVLCKYPDGQQMSLQSYASRADRNKRAAQIKNWETNTEVTGWRTGAGEGQRNGTLVTGTTDDGQPYAWWTYDQADRYAVYVRWPDHSVTDLADWWAEKAPF